MEVSSVSNSKMKSKPKIAAVIPVYNNKNIGKCVSALLAQSISEEDFEVIVVDNGTEYDLREYLPRAKNLFYYKMPEKNRSLARNLGTKKSSSNIVVFVDSDCIVKRDFMKNILEEFKDKEVIAVGASICNSNYTLISKFFHLIRYGKLLTPVKLQVDMVGTGGAAFYRKHLISIGGFDREMVWGEDTDISQRIRKFGKIILSAKVKIYHKTEDEISLQWRKMYKAGEAFYQTRKKYPNLSYSFLIRNRLFFLFVFPLLILISPLRDFSSSYFKSLNFLEKVWFYIFALLPYSAFWFGGINEAYR